MASSFRCGSVRAVPETTLLVKDIQLLLTMNSSGDEIADGALYVKGNVIGWVGRTSEIPERFSKADQILSLPDRVVMPGTNATGAAMIGATQAANICAACMRVIACGNKIRKVPVSMMSGHALHMRRHGEFAPPHGSVPNALRSSGDK